MLDYIIAGLTALVAGFFGGFVTTVFDIKRRKRNEERKRKETKQ